MSEVTTKQYTGSEDWKTPLITVSVAIVALLIVYFPTTSSIIEIWNRSETYTHGYLILPISIWLLWRNKHYFAGLKVTPSYAAFPLMLIASFLWFIAYSVDIQVVQQLMLVAMIPLLVLAIMGWSIAKTAAFPLLFLFFAVPMGEDLVPPLIDFTADFTVSMVQLTGIPIYREGTYFQLPSGNWSVVEACSGVRYLIASVTLGFLYSYLTYTSYIKRTIFIILSIIVPIIANGLRAFMIVMIGHFSDMELAVGVDHLIYGWIFFGVVIAILFYVGSFFRDDEEVEIEKIEVKHKENTFTEKGAFFKVSVFVFIISLVFPLYAYQENKDVVYSNINLQVPNIVSWQKKSELMTEWVPNYSGFDEVVKQSYSKNKDEFFLYIGFFAKQRSNAQLITSTNKINSPKDKKWKGARQGTLDLHLDEKKITVEIHKVWSKNQELLALHYYYIDQSVESNKYLAKLKEVSAKLISGKNRAALVVMATPYTENVKKDRDKLKKIAESSVKPILRAIGNAKVQNEG